MPALISYSPYETLVFFQNVAYHGADKSSLQNISTTLNQNQLIRDSDDYDASKFSPDALHHLYTRTINAHRSDRPNGVNGDSASNNENPLKRKLSSSPTPSPSDDTGLFLQHFVNNLYAKFKEETIKELRQQEEEYQRLQNDIEALEGQVKAEQIGRVQQPDTTDQDAETSRPSSARDLDQPDPVSMQLRADLEAAKNDVKPVHHPGQTQVAPQPPPLMPQPYEGSQPSPLPTQRTSTPKSSTGTPVPRHQQPPQLPLQSQHHSPGAFNRTLPPPSPQRNNYGSLPPPPHAFPQHSQNQPQPSMLPPIHNLQRVPSHEGYGPRAPNQGRGSPMPQHPQQAYNQYPQYPQHPQHGWHSPAPQQYQQSQYPPQQHYPPQPPARYPQVHTPNQQPYQPYPHTAPIPYGVQPSQWRAPPVPPYHQYPASAGTTPVPRSESRGATLSSATSTPWKRRNLPPGFRPRSPTRLDREVSPLSDTESTSPVKPVQKSEGRSRRDTTSKRRAATPAGNLSRSQSVMSNRSDTPNPPKRKVGRPPKIKPEAPSTPAPVTSDSEQQQRSSGRRGRARTSTLSNKTEVGRTATATKRKREGVSASPIPRGRSSSNAQPASMPRSVVQHSDPNFVMVSKTFGRTSLLLLNEITSHKLAGIFAKPLSERDAPGYRTLISRPQDLKSIKAAVSKGSRAAISAIEKLEAEGEAGETGDEEATPTPVARTVGLSEEGINESNVTEGAIGNGFYHVRATEELVPPKGIVNSAQLETELVRMFANAVMFNPLPTSERGFGRSLRLRRRGGELAQYGARRERSQAREAEEGDEEDEDEESEAARSASGTSETESSAAGADDTGIIVDAREMFSDVEKLVTRWRDLERASSSGSWQVPGPMANVSASAVGSGTERHASVSASSAAGEEDEGEGIGRGTPSVGVGASGRKRRKFGDR